MRALPTPALTIPALIRLRLLGKPKRLEGPVRKQPMVRIKNPTRMNGALFVWWGTKSIIRVTNTDPDERKKIQSLPNRVQTHLTACRAGWDPHRGKTLPRISKPEVQTTLPNFRVQAYRDCKDAPVTEMVA